MESMAAQRLLAGALSATLAALSPLAAAQLKFKDPSAPSTPSLSNPTPAAPPAPTTPTTPTAPTYTAKQKAAIEVAEKWLAMIDRGEYGKAWDQSAPLFQSKVKRTQWVEGLPKSREPLGAMKSRTLEAVGVPEAPKEQANLEFLQLGFNSEFEKNDKAQEAVMLVLVKGIWRPVGYLIR